MTRNKKKFSFLKFLLLIIVVIIVINLISSLFADNGSSTISNNPAPVNNTDDDGKNSYDGFQSVNTHYSSAWQLQSNVGKLDLQVAPGIRDKRTQILGSSKDSVTVMVYMCGSDLESQAAMGTYDLQEMAGSKLSDNVNVIVYTGGTTKWNNQVVSSRYNQIYKILGNGQLATLVDNAGTGAMIDPDNLQSFIEYCAENFPANRYELILWDHGGGTVSGYGYDEKFPRNGSMSLSSIDKALTRAGVTFDFVGFDACLMATTETALMLSEHADYMIASEESEPGIGWYYTNWLNKLSANTSISTVELGKIICDDFVGKCRQDTPRQTATLSVIDLAEVEGIIPKVLSAFADSTNKIIDSDFRRVASARKGSREFAADQYIDMVDLVDLASKLDTNEARELEQALMSAIKYNNTSNDISNAYGLSIYFPYRSTRYVNTVLNVYDNIEMNNEYREVVRNFATYQTSGQVASGGSHSAYQSYDNYDYSQYYSGEDSAEALFDILNLFMGGGFGNDDAYSSYYGSGLDILFGRNISKKMTEYIADNHFDGDLNWKDGKISLTDKQWSMVAELKLNMFVDDGKGYVDLGKDNVYEIDDQGNLLSPGDPIWVVASVDQQNWQPVAFYFLYDVEDGDNLISYSRIPVRVNGIYANLIVKSDEETMEVIGISYDYKEDSAAVAKNLSEFSENDEVEFVCDYYLYDGSYDNTYTLGDKLTIKDKLYVGDGLLDEKTLASYEFKDIYGQSYYSSAIK